MSSPFYALLYRLKLVPRWSGTFSLQPEDVAQHSHSVTVISHLLCMIKQNIFGEEVDLEEVMAYAIFHDSSNAILTHVIGPVKGHRYVQKPFRAMEEAVEEKLVEMLPYDLQPSYRKVFSFDGGSDSLQIVEMADQIDALCKAKLELNRGNYEFQVIHDQIEQHVGKQAIQYPYVRYFLDQFLPPLTDRYIDYRYL